MLFSSQHISRNEVQLANMFPRTVTVRFKAVGSAPILRQQICKITATQRFEAVVAYLRRVLKCGPQDSVFLYVNSTFAPALDEIVGNLHRVSALIHFSRDSYLLKRYSMNGNDVPLCLERMRC
jgi:ubiquitin-like protein ATG12